MKNIVKEVWKTLDNSPIIRRAMSYGLINTRALAIYLINERKIDAPINAVISAIRRYQLDHHDDIFKTAQEVISQTIISIKSRLANVALIKDAEIQGLLPKLFSIIQYNRGDVLRIIQADESIKILVDEKNLKKVKELFPEDKIIKVDENLAEINMHLHPEAVNTPGIITIASTELALNGINVIETMSCVPEMLWFVKEKDIIKAHQVLHQLCQPNKK